MTHYLVLTAIGTDRTGIVSQLTKLASECGCNIDDSRMAIFGNEFTLIMLLSGALPAITNIENKLPPVAVALELITMMKRTTNHRNKTFTQHFDVEYAGPDSPGVLKAITEFFAERNIDISSLRSQLHPVNNRVDCSLSISLTEQSNNEGVTESFAHLCEQLGLEGRIKPIEQLQID